MERTAARQTLRRLARHRRPQRHRVDVVHGVTVDEAKIAEYIAACRTFEKLEHGSDQEALDRACDDLLRLHGKLPIAEKIEAQRRLNAHCDRNAL